VDPEDLKPAPEPDRDAVALEPVSGRKPLSGLPPVESLALPSPAGAMNDLGPPLVAEDRDAERGPPPPPAGPDSPSAPPAGPAAETDPPASGKGEEAPSAPPAGAKPFEFLGSGLGLFPLKLARLACSALGAAALLLGAALLASSVPFELPALPDSVPPEAVERALGVPPAARDLLPAAYRDLPHVYGPVLGAGAVLLALACWFHRSVRIHRWSRTFVLGEPVAVEAGLFSDLAFAFASGIVLLGTAGLAAPWIVAWSRRRFFQACTVKTSRREKKMDFAGTGGEALGLLLLSAASILLAPLTLGIWIAYLRFRWAAWEMAGLLVPSPSGHGMRRARFAGAAGPFLLSEAAGAALRLLTGTLYGPWATSARWRRIAAGTELPPDEREEKRAKRGRTERDEA
jgi:hypothetical protein